MKYIRTKESVNPIERQEDIELFERTNQRLADTIEELCDRFVYWDVRHGYQTYPKLCDYREEDIEFIKSGTIIYGAIWTDKGLIYVAKMSDKGELELL